MAYKTDAQVSAHRHNTYTCAHIRTCTRTLTQTHMQAHIHRARTLTHKVVFRILRGAKLASRRKNKILSNSMLAHFNNNNNNCNNIIIVNINNNNNNNNSNNNNNNNNNNNK